VTLNYRVHVLGFLTGRESFANGAVNLGLRDQLLGLEWVQDNIHAFGGDPKQVTVFGQSAGAISIAVLYHTQRVLDKTRPQLFQRAIMMSGAQSTIPLGMPAAQMRQHIFDEIAVAAGCATKPAANATKTMTPVGPNQKAWECLKALPAEKLQNASNAVENNPTNLG
jgi:carboxylesterase type B